MIFEQSKVRLRPLRKSIGIPQSTSLITLGRKTGSPALSPIDVELLKAQRNSLQASIANARDA